MCFKNKKALFRVVGTVILLLTLVIWFFIRQQSPLVNCSSFTNNNEVVDCSISKGYPHGKTIDYVCVFDKIVKDENNYFLLVKNKNENNEWIDQKFYLGEENQYIGFDQQLESEISLSKNQSKRDSVTYQLKDLPVSEYNLKLKKKEVLVLVFKEEYSYQGLKKVSNIRYIKK